MPNFHEYNPEQAYLLAPSVLEFLGKEPAKRYNFKLRGTSCAN
jgi:hypothetical protein